MIFDIITIFLLIAGICGIVNRNFNFIGVILSLDIMAIAVFINLVLTGITQNDKEALTLAFFGIIAAALLNAVTTAIVYVYFNKKETMDIAEETVRDT